MEMTMSDGHELEWTAMDYRALTPEQRDAVKARAIRRARQERAEAIRALVSRLVFWRKRSVAANELATAEAIAACYEPRHC